MVETYLKYMKKSFIMHKLIHVMTKNPLNVMTNVNLST